MTDDDKPGVELSFTTHWCPRHLEPFRARWPRGAGVAMLELFGAWVADPRVAEMAPITAGGKRDAGALDAIALETSPLCCFVGDEAMAALYRRAGDAAGIRIDPPPPA